MIEMMVVLIIIALLVGVGIRFYLGYIENARVTKAKAQLAAMQAAMDSWYAEKGEYPTPPEDGENIKDTELEKAGIRATKETENERYVVDPWGKNYQFTREDVAPGTNNKYTIKTGYADVQGTGKALQGTGTDGKSEPPDFEP